MKNLVLLLLFLAVTIRAAAAADPLLGQLIVADRSLQGTAAEKAVLDLEQCLERATGKAFTIRFSDSPLSTGINLFPVAKASLSPALQAELNRSGAEAVAIQDGEHRVLLAAPAAPLLRHAVYTYLDELGFRWYFPGELWSHTPRLAQLHPPASGVRQPVWRSRTYFGTGAIAPLPGLDPESRLPQTWEQWSHRNRFGSEAELGGHYGEIFNLRHRQELEAHPEYLALVGGKRVPWSESAKHCLSNAALRRLYLADRLKEARDRVAGRRFPGEAVAVSVDPSDGGGHCECAQCARLGSISERVFGLANEVARAIRPLGPRVYANIYAYNLHVAPPSFTLADNLITQIIPYAFQNYGTPQKMIGDWVARSKNLLIYDYYGIPDWHHNLPLSARWSPDTLVAHMAYWNARGLKGFGLESSYSIGSTGRGLYLAGRYGWIGKLAKGAEDQRFYRDLFPGGEAAAQQYFSKLASGFNGVNDAVFLLHALERARRESSGAVATRFLHLQAYLVYVIRYYGWKTAEPAARQQRWSELMAYIYRIYFTGLVHSTRLAELFINQSGLEEGATRGWNPYRPEAEHIRAIKPASEGDLAAAVHQELRANPLLAAFPYDPPKARSYAVRKGHGRPADEEGMMILNMPETYVRPGSDGNVHLDLRVNIGTPDNKTQRFPAALVDTLTGARYSAQEVRIDANWKRLTLRAPADRVYRLDLQPASWIRLRVPPRQWLGFRNIPMYAVLGRLYFYLPPGTGYFYFSCTTTGMPVFQDESGRKLTPEAVNSQKLYRIAVPAAAKGNWWSIDEAQYQTLQFYGRPDLFFLMPDLEVR